MNHSLSAGLGPEYNQGEKDEEVKKMAEVLEAERKRQERDLAEENAKAKKRKPEAFYK